MPVIELRNEVEEGASCVDWSAHRVVQFVLLRSSNWHAPLARPVEDLTRIGFLL
jgi:hypothetical protein